MYIPLSHRKLVQICTNLYLTRSQNKYVQISPPPLAGTSMQWKNLSPSGSWYKYVQISLSQETGTKLYKSLLSQEAGTNMYKSLSHRKPVPICKNLSPSGGWYKYVHTNLSLTGSRYLYVQISLSQGAGTNMYKSLFHKKLLQICMSLFLTVSW